MEYKDEEKYQDIHQSMDRVDTLITQAIVRARSLCPENTITVLIQYNNGLKTYRIGEFVDLFERQMLPFDIYDSRIQVHGIFGEYDGAGDLQYTISEQGEGVDFTIQVYLMEDTDYY